MKHTGYGKMLDEIRDWSSQEIWRLITGDVNEVYTSWSEEIVAKDSYEEVGKPCTGLRDKECVIDERKLDSMFSMLMDLN
ncbi:unnamed protein product [Arabis nemorensis]|uniref:Uncharacterized protein n=1 Tax=Arabis nemorensis TaxID=586526 RepID=A0A565AZR5_9BRAS|nr:unnamed protein product [Arabis nemorensis]